MQESHLGPLRVRRFVKGGQARDIAHDGSDGPLTVVLLHGFGAPGGDLVGFGHELDVPDGTAFVFPEAPIDLAARTGEAMFGEARAWWLIDFARMERAVAAGELRDLSADVPEGMAEARSAVDAMLDALVAEGAGRIVLGGFSQGAMLSLDVALRSSRPLAGVVVLSGTLLAEHEWTPLMPARSDLPVFQSHGTVDPLLPYSIAERLRDALKGAGMNVTFEGFRGPHAIPAVTLKRLGEWLRELK